MPEVVADLHLHSTCSDGLNSPEEIAMLVEKEALCAFSLTDHDSVAGHEECRAAATSAQFIPGIELTSTHNGVEVHILGYWIDSENPELLETIDEIAIKRQSRLLDIVDSLRENYQIHIDRDELAEAIGSGSWNRLNLARFIIESGLAGSLAECFNNYLGDNSDIYQAVDFFPPPKAISLIKRAGGVPFLAHPGISSVHKLVPWLKENGLAGLELYHPSHSGEDMALISRLATEYDLAVSGGSDFHGTENSRRKIKAAGLTADDFDKFIKQTPKGCVTA